MALWGKFIVDNQPVLSLVMFGVGTFPAFSGNEIYRNRGGCTALAELGPLPPGKYWVVDRPSGGLGSKALTWAKDVYNGYKGAPSDHSEWFALYRDDELIDDHTWINGVKRGNFRLHPVGGQGVSFGCITLSSNADFQTLRRSLLHTNKINAGRSGLKAYGWIDVVAYGNTCP